MQEVVVLEPPDPLHERESLLDSSRQGESDRPVELDHRRRVELGEAVVEEDDLLPWPLLRVSSGDRGLKLVRAGTPEPYGVLENA